jgi:hypothetical protein
MPTKPQENSIRFFNLPPNEQARIIQRWEDKIEYEPNTGCWLWSGRTNYSGYGHFCLDSKAGVKAHRFSLQLKIGRALGPSESACHRCDTPACVNPEHLFVGTHLENMRDSIRKGRRPSVRGSLNAISKLTEEQVSFIRSTTPFSPVKLARHFGVHRKTISAIRRGKGWAHVS